MNRRGFLGLLGAAVAGATLDPERALWRPGRLISIPRPVDLWDRPFLMPIDTISQVEFARRYPGPFLVTANVGGDVDCARVAEGLINHRYNTDRKFRAALDNAVGLHDRMLVDDLARSELRDVRRGVGYYRRFFEQGVGVTS